MQKEMWESSLQEAASQEPTESKCVRWKKAERREMCLFKNWENPVWPCIESRYPLVSSDVTVHMLTEAKNSKSHARTKAML